MSNRTSTGAFGDLRQLLAILSLRDRGKLTIVVLIAAVAAVVEIGTIAAIFGYIGALTSDGSRARLVRGVYELVLGSYSHIEFTVVGGGLVAALVVLKNILAARSERLAIGFILRRYHAAVTHVFRHIMRLDLEAFAQKARGSRAATLREDIHGVFNNALVALVRGASDACLLVLIFALLVVVDWRITLVAAGLLGGAGWSLGRLLRRRITQIGSENRLAIKNANRFFLEGLAGFVEARILGKEDFFVDGYNRLVGISTEKTLSLRTYEAMPRALNEAIVFGGILFIMMFYTLAGENMDKTLPTLAIFGIAGIRATNVISRLSANLQTIAAESVRYPRVRQALIAASEHEPIADKASLGTFRNEIRISQASYAYPGSTGPAVFGLDLTIRRGEFVGIVGRSGSGKSTLLALLLGLIDPRTGVVTVDGVSLPDCRRSWQDKVGYIGQAPFIFDGTIRDNVALGEASPDDTAVWEALKTAQLDAMVAAHPDGLDRVLENDGSNLSGGQRQRLAIARALYRKPEILVFDEATSALDNETEQALSQAIARLSGKVTIISVAHRLTSIQAADRIVFMKNGRIVDEGHYDALLAASADFRRMVHVTTDHGAECRA